LIGTVHSWGGRVCWEGEIRERKYWFFFVLKSLLNRQVGTIPIADIATKGENEIQYPEKK